MDAALIFFIIECVGVVAYSVSAAIIAIDHKVDLFGVLLLTVITTFGGGMTRDFLLGNTPPLAFREPAYWVLIVISVATALAVFVIARILQQRFSENEERIERIDNIFDALALGVFATSGARVVMEYAGGLYEKNWFLVITLAMLTAAGGGMIRDVMLGRVPLVLRKRIYAIAAIAGAISYYILVRLSAPQNVAIIVGSAVTFVLRMCATYFKWNLPKAIE